MNLREPEVSEIARKVLNVRYLAKNADGEVIETPKERYLAVAKAISDAEKEYSREPRDYTEDFYTLMASRDFFPNTPCVANAGRENGTDQFSACFVLPVEDSLVSIYDTAKHAALIHQSGGGTGFSFSKLRPREDRVKSSIGVASGPVSFMGLYNDSTDVIKQGSIRRGANMGILRVDHPDILEFIDCKRTTTVLKNFNISVAITNAFMEALASGGDYDLINPRDGSVYGKLNAKAVFDRIVQNAWLTGDPGLFFIDRVNEKDPLSHILGPINATNPCGEVPLRDYDACTLGSINLGNFVEDGKLLASDLFDAIGLAVRFLDNVLTVSRYPVPEIKDVTSKCRKIGLGVMGWADYLIKLGIPYDSDLGILEAERVMSFINSVAIGASHDLAKERGAYFYWEKVNLPGMLALPSRRNSTVTVLAPTGSISILADCSGGIEPLFSLATVRNQAGMKMLDINQSFVARARSEGWYTDAIMEEVAKTGSCQNVDGVPDAVKAIYKVAADISPEWHVKMQAAFQKHVEDGVSKTVNLPKTATVDDVRQAYELAWELGCKGITVYRDGSHQEQVLTSGTATTAEVAKEAPVTRKRAIPDDGIRWGATMSKETALGKVHVTVNDHPADGQPFEAFINMGRSGSEVAAFTEALGRTISYALAAPGDSKPVTRLRDLGEQLTGIAGTGRAGFGDNKVESTPDAVGRVLVTFSEMYSDGTVKRPEQGNKDLCPSCQGVNFQSVSGCNLCSDCGYSKC